MLIPPNTTVGNTTSRMPAVRMLASVMGGSSSSRRPGGNVAWIFPTETWAKELTDGKMFRMPPTRPYHHGDLPAALLAAAAAEIAEVGPAAMSLRKVAGRAGVSHTAAAHHFGDKRGL